MLECADKVANTASVYGAYLKHLKSSAKKNLVLVGANYHMLNTIAEYKEFVPKGKTGLRNYNKSKYCSANTVKVEFEALIKNANFKYIFLSYNNEGLMSIKDIKSIMSKYGHYDLAETNYQRFKADSNRNNKANATVEYLHILEKNHK